MSVTVQRPTLGLFDEQRTSLEAAIELTVASLRHYGSLYKHWAISFSGGKDSSAVVTLVIHLIETGQIPKPENLMRSRIIWLRCYIGGCVMCGIGC